MYGRHVKYGLAAVAVALIGTGAHTADHGDGPLISGTARSADIGDMFLFLDPNDNDFLVAAMTVQGFIVPGEAVNFSVFDHRLQFRFEFETTGNALRDYTVKVKFDQKQTSGATPQTATISAPGRRFSAPTTVSNLSPTSPTPVVTTDPQSGISFFAGEVDDPFPFDIPAFGRFVASVLAGSPNPAQLNRGRDTFAGYNTLAIALRIPLAAFGAPADATIGLNGVTLLDNLRQDRAGNPAVNVALIPFPRKNEHNVAQPKDDAAGRFTSSIVATLTALGTNATNIGVLANLAIVNGDYLRVDASIANTGSAGGTNPEAAFPNGRRLGDDVIDTIIAVVTNGAITTGDNAVAELTPRNAFPFFAPTHQPFAPGTVDDLTRN